MRQDNPEEVPEVVSEQTERAVAEAWGDYGADRREPANGLCALADRMVQRIDAALAANGRRMAEVCSSNDTDLDVVDQLVAEANRVVRGEEGATTAGWLTALAIVGAIAAGVVMVGWLGERGGWMRCLVALAITAALVAMIVADFRAWDQRTALARLEHHTFESGCPLCATFDDCPIAASLSREAHVRVEVRP